MPAIKVGSATVYPIIDCVVDYPLSIFFSKAQRNAEGLDPLLSAGAPEGATRMPVRGWLLKLPTGDNVLFDTGVGPYEDGDRMILRENLFQSLKTAGLEREDVQHVVISHLHKDHTGWTVLDGKPAFPKAKYYLQQAELDYFTSKVSLRTRCEFDMRSKPLMDADVLILLKKASFKLAQSGDCSVVLEQCSGHTPGHMILRLAEGKDIAYFIGDALHFDMQISCPSCSTNADVDPKAAAESRKALLQRAQKEDAFLMTAHLQGEGYGKVVPHPEKPGKLAIKLVPSESSSA